MKALILKVLVHIKKLFKEKTINKNLEIFYFYGYQ